MPDITMCTNKKCPKRLECYRYCAIPESGPWVTLQSYFDPNPEGGKDCEYFMPLTENIEKEKEMKTGYDFMKVFKNDTDFLLEYLQLNIIELIIQTMKRNKISKQELAKRIDTNPAYITKLFRTTIPLTLETLVRIAYGLNVDISFGFHKKEEKSK